MALRGKIRRSRQLGVCMTAKELSAFGRKQPLTLSNPESSELSGGTYGKFGTERPDCSILNSGFLVTS